MNQVKNIFVFLGPPGSGKGSLSFLCEQKFQWKRLSTGDLCRKNIMEETPIGKEIDFALKSGKLVKDQVIGTMVFSWINSSVNNFENIILDGFPRTVSQAAILHDFIHQKLEKVTLKVVRLISPTSKLLERLSSRLVCLEKDCQAIFSSLDESLFKPKKAMTCDICLGSLGKRQDDADIAAQERLFLYGQHEQRLLDFYRDKDQEIFDLNVEGSFCDVFDKFQEFIGIKAI